MMAPRNRHLPGAERIKSVFAPLRVWRPNWSTAKARVPQAWRMPASARSKWKPLGWLRVILGQWRLLAAALVAAAIIHIVATLTSAQFSEATSFRVLTRDLPVNQVAFGQPVTSVAQPLPFYAPDALHSYCRYDASTSRIRLSAVLPDVGWSLSLHTPKGENFYFVPGIERRTTTVELVLEPPGSVFAYGDLEIAAANQSIPVVKLPDVRGLAILRAPIKGLAYRRQMDELRATFKCRAQGEVIPQ